MMAMTARFNSGTPPADGDSRPAPGSRPKVPVHPTVSSGPPVNAKKPVLEGSLSGSAASSVSAPKPSFLKGTVSTSSAPEIREMPKSRLVSRFEAAQKDAGTKPSFGKHFPPKPKPGDSSQDGETKSPFHKLPPQKPPLGVAAPMASTANDHKPTMPKPPPAVAKPPWLKDTSKSEENTTTTTPAPPKPLAQKPKSSLAQIRQHTEDSTLPKPFGVRAAQNMFNKDKGEDRVNGDSTAGSKPPPPFLSQKPVLSKKPSGPGGPLVSDDPSAPKRNPLPNIFALGSAPAKPNRPPNVSLDRFTKGMAAEPIPEGKHYLTIILAHDLNFNDTSLSVYTHRCKIIPSTWQNINVKTPKLREEEQQLNCTKGSRELLVMT